MKLFEFYYCGRGSYYIIMSNTPEEALINLIEFLKNSYSRGMSYDYYIWKNAKINYLPKGYILRALDINQVIVCENI